MAGCEQWRGAICKMPFGFFLANEMESSTYLSGRVLPLYRKSLNSPLLPLTFLALKLQSYITLCITNGILSSSILSSILPIVHQISRSCPTDLPIRVTLSGSHLSVAASNLHLHRSRSGNSTAGLLNLPLLWEVAFRSAADAVWHLLRLFALLNIILAN